MAVLITLVLLAAVIAVVSAPLLRRGTPEGTLPEDGAGDAVEVETPRHADLSAAREAKYREIRDAELDYKTGKLSQADYEAIDATLRAEALEILDQLEALEALSTRVSSAG
ncbi:MAG TPA: hypothetical protein VGI26_04975 [Solirubrobacteraceae bacterium]|jgi:hypothetical protein